MEGEPDLVLQLNIPDLDAPDDALAQSASRRSENGLSLASSRRRMTYKEKSSCKSVGPENSLTADAEMMALVRARASRANRLVGSPDELEKDFAWKVDVSSLELDRIDSIMTSAGVGHLSLATAMRAVEIAKPFTRPAAQWIKGSAKDPSEVDRILLEAEQIERESSGHHLSRAQAVVIEPAVKSPTEEAQPSPTPKTRLEGFWAPGQPQHCTADVAGDPRFPNVDDANLARDLFQGHGERFANRLDVLAQERGDDLLIERVVNEAADAFFELLAADVELEERCADCRKPTHMMRADWLRRAARILDAQEVHYVTACDAGSGSRAGQFATRAMHLFRKHGQRCRELQASDDSEKIALCVVVQVAFDSDADQLPRKELHVLVAQRRQLLDQEQQWTSLQHEEAQWLAEMYHQLLDEERGLNTKSDVGKSLQASVEMRDTSTDPLLSEEELISAACKQRASQLPTDIVGTDVTSFAALVEHVQDICKTFFDASRASLLIPRDMERRTAFFGHASAVRPRKIDFAAKASHALDIGSVSMKQSTTTASTPRNHDLQSAPERREKRSLSQSPRCRRQRGHRRQSLSRRASILESSDILGTIMLEMKRAKVSPWLALDCPGDNNERISPLKPFSECDAALAWNIEKDHALVRCIAEKKSTRSRDMFREVSELCVPIFAADAALQEDEEVFLGVLRLERALEQTHLCSKAEGKYFERSSDLHARMKEPFEHMDEIVGDECAPMIANALSQYLRDAGDQEKRAATMREWEGEVENLARSCTVQAQLTDVRRGILSASSSTKLCEQLAQGLYKSLWLGDLDSLRICAETMHLSDENLLGPSAQAFQRTMLDVHAPSAWDPELEMMPFEMPIAASLRALYTHRKPQLPKLDLARTQQMAVKLIIIDHQDHVPRWERSSAIDPDAQLPKSNRGEETTDTVTKGRKTRELSKTKKRRMEIVPGLYENSGLVERIDPRDPTGPARAGRSEDSGPCPWLVQYLRDFDLWVAAAVVDVASKQRLAMKCNARGATFPEEVFAVDDEEIDVWTEWAAKSSSRWAFEIAFSLSQSSTIAAKKEVVYFCQALALDEHQEEEDFSVWSMDDVLVRTGRGDLEILHWVNAVSPLIAETLRHLAKVEHARERQEDHRIEMDEIRHDMAETGLRCFREYLTSAGMHDRAALLASSDESNNPNIPHGILVCGDLGTFCAKHDLPSQAEHPEELMALPSQPAHADISTVGDDQGLARLDTSDLAEDLREKMWDFMQRANQDPRRAILRATSSQVSSLALAHIAETIQPACAGLIEQTHLLLDTDNIVVYLMPEEHDVSQGLKPVYAAASGKTRWEVAENFVQSEFDVEAARCVVEQGAKVLWSEDEILASVPLHCPNDEMPCFGVCQFRFSRPLEKMNVAEQIMLGCSAMVSFDLDVCLRSARDSECLARAETINRSIAEAVHSISPEHRSDWARRLEVAEALESAAHEIVPCEFVAPLLQVQIDGRDAFIRLEDARNLKSPAACQKDLAKVPFVFRSDLAVNEKFSQTLEGASLSGHDASSLHVFLEASMNNFCIVPFAKCDGLLFLGNRVRFSPQPAPLHHVSWVHRPPPTNDFSEQDTNTLATLMTIIA